jgi:adenosylhomocysteine nucleosidase
MNVAETLVAVPQAKELEPLLGTLVAAGYQPRKVTLGRLECHLVEELRLLFAVGGHGKTQLAVRTQHLIEQRADFQVVICAGAAGNLGGDLALGDVVVGLSTIEHDYKLRFVRRALPSHQADAHLLAEFRRAASQIDQDFRVLFGAIASGDEDIIDPARALELRKATGALCVAWEGAGAARAASFSGLQFLEVRAITDGADRTAAADFEANLKRSMPNLAQVLVKWSLTRRRDIPTHGSGGRSSPAAES